MSISLKDVEGLNFEKACVMLKNVIGREASRFKFLLESDKLDKNERDRYEDLLHTSGGVFSFSEELTKLGLQVLCDLLSKHYGSKVVLLIDEYDVPLDKAFQNGYYDEMVSLIRGMFGSVLKTNPNLKMAVLTGCLRILKESIFTGLNNLKVYNITDIYYNEYFGFVEQEVKDMLKYYGLSGNEDIVKEWYNGYKFGNTSVYCPWDVINYCYDARRDKEMKPRNYWANTSGNSMIRRFIDMADQETKEDLEELVNGNCIIKNIKN